MTKEAKIVHARAFKAIDNPGNIIVFIKSYAKGEKPSTFGKVIQSSFLANVRSEMAQAFSSLPFDKQMSIQQNDDNYLVSYGDHKCMTYRTFFGHLFKWANKTNADESEFNMIDVDGVMMTLHDILSRSNELINKKLKAA